MTQVGKQWDKQRLHSGPGGPSCPGVGWEVVAGLSVYGAPLGIYKMPAFSASIQLHRRNQDMYEKVAKLCGFFICSGYENEGTEPR